MPSLLVPPRPETLDRDLTWLEILAALRSNVLRLLPCAAYEEDVVILRLFGRRHFLLNEPQAIHRVLVERHENYRRPPATRRILRPIVGDGLLLSEGEDWQRQRRTVAPAFANRIVPVLARHIVGAATDAVYALTESCSQPIDLLAPLQALALEIAARSMFSLEMHCHGPAMRRLINDYRPRLGQPSQLDVILPNFIPTPRDLARARFRPRWVALMDAIIDQRLEMPKSEKPRDLFDLLAAAQDPDTKTGLSRAQLRDQVATMIVAGHETTALALFWALYLLAAAPEIQNKVASEVRGIEFGPNAAGELLQKLPFTRAVANETLRLYPPAFIIARQALTADRCGETSIPAGALVVISPWVLHRHVRRWSQPDAFDPERFLRDETPQRLSYMPFGAGPRVCVGAQFGLAEVILVLAMLVKEFEFQLASTRQVMPAAVVSMQPDHRVPFQIRKR
jgi:cytochrome P450